MKASIVLAAAAAFVSGAALAQPPGPPTTTICLDVAGQKQPVTCRSQSASRINRAEDICQCLKEGQPVTVAICPAGVTPPPESAAYARERYAAVRHGSLVGATWRGRPICVTPHQGG
jgi:hypothetical protein